MVGYKALGIIFAALSLGAVLTFATTASAQTQPKQKKVSYEEAFRRCKAYMDKEMGGLKHDTINELTRTARGRACMEKFGHKL
jgi:hypothetical protein